MAEIEETKPDISGIGEQEKEGTFPITSTPKGSTEIMSSNLNPDQSEIKTNDDPQTSPEPQHQNSLVNLNNQNLVSPEVGEVTENLPESATSPNILSNNAAEVDPIKASNVTIMETEISASIPEKTMQYSNYSLRSNISNAMSFYKPGIAPIQIDGNAPSVQLTTISTTLYANQERPNKHFSQIFSVSASKLEPGKHRKTESKESLEMSRNASAVHYLTPMSQMSARSVNEGDVFEDYMRFIIQPFEKESIVELSSESSTYVSCIEVELQRTIVIIKPDAVVYKDVILRVIEEKGFQIIGTRFLHLTPEQVSEIYAKHYGSPSFPHLVISTSSAPVLVLSLAAVDAINKWKAIVGPDNSLKEEWFYPISVRPRFGIKKTMSNVLHASDNQKESNRENRYFYPDSILEPLITDLPKVNDYCGVYVLPTLSNGLVEVVKKKPIDPIMFLADWLLMNNPFQPRLPYNIAVTPT